MCFPFRDWVWYICSTKKVDLRFSSFSLSLLVKKGKVSLTHQGKAGESLFGIRWKWWNGRPGRNEGRNFHACNFQQCCSLVCAVAAVHLEYVVCCCCCVWWWWVVGPLSFWLPVYFCSIKLETLSSFDL